MGALGDEHLGGGDGVMLSSFVRSMKSYFGGMMTSFCFLALLGVVVFGDDMMNWLSLISVRISRNINNVFTHYLCQHHGWVLFGERSSEIYC